MDSFLCYSPDGHICIIEKLGDCVMEKNKKGELTTKQIVTLIILIASFVIILILIFRLDLGNVTSDEICHNSVVLKSTAKSLVGELDCETSYVCISGGGDCDDINPTETFDVDLGEDEEEVQDQIMELLAEELADCWWMFGEGELAYMGTDFQGDHCAICSVVKFDSSIQEEVSEITYEGFYGYLLETEYSDTQTYLVYLYGVYNIDSVTELNPDLDIYNEEISTSDKFMVVTGINPNWPNKDGIIYPFIVKYDEVKSKTSCDVFDVTQS